MSCCCSADVAVAVACCCSTDVAAVVVAAATAADLLAKRQTDFKVNTTKQIEIEMFAVCLFCLHLQHLHSHSHLHSAKKGREKGMVNGVVRGGRGSCRCITLTCASSSGAFCFRTTKNT